MDLKNDKGVLFRLLPVKRTTKKSPALPGIRMNGSAKLFKSRKEV